MAEKTVSGYIAQLNDNQGEIVSKVRTIILEVVPEATESINREFSLILIKALKIGTAPN